MNSRVDLNLRPRSPASALGSPSSSSVGDSYSASPVSELRPLLSYPTGLRPPAPTRRNLEQSLDYYLKFACQQQSTTSMFVNWLFGNPSLGEGRAKLQEFAETPLGLDLMCERLLQLNAAQPEEFAELFSILRNHTNNSTVVATLLSCLQSMNLSPLGKAVDVVLALAPVAAQPDVVESLLRLCLRPGFHEQLRWAVIHVLSQNVGPEQLIDSVFSLNVVSSSESRDFYFSIISKIVGLPGAYEHLVAYIIVGRAPEAMLAKLLDLMLTMANSDGVGLLVESVGREQPEGPVTTAVAEAIHRHVTLEHVRAYVVETAQVTRSNWRSKLPLLNGFEHLPEIYSQALRLLLDELAQNRDPEMRQSLQIVLRRAAIHPQARAAIATQFVTEAVWNTELGWTAFDILCDRADAKIVYGIYNQLLASGSLKGEIKLEHVAPCDDVQAPRSFAGTLAKGPNSAALFFTALFVVEEYQRRIATALPASLVAQLHQFAATHSRSKVLEFIRINAPAYPTERKRWMAWALEAVLSPPHHSIVATQKSFAPFRCCVCLEDKLPHERVVLNACTNNALTPVCLGCAQTNVLNAKIVTLIDRCPTGCCALLSLQDMSALMMPPDKIEGYAARLAGKLFRALPLAKACKEPDCFGGACIDPQTITTTQCLVCQVPMTCGTDRALIRRMLVGIGPLTQGQAITRSCMHCSSPTERFAGCDHMTCTECAKEWHFVNGVYPNSAPVNPAKAQNYRPWRDDILAEIGFYNGIPCGPLSPENAAVVQARAEQWLRDGIYSQPREVEEI